MNIPTVKTQHQSDHPKYRDFSIKRMNKLCRAGYRSFPVVYWKLPGHMCCFTCRTSSTYVAWKQHLQFNHSCALDWVLWQGSYTTRQLRNGGRSMWWPSTILWDAVWGSMPAESRIRHMISGKQRIILCWCYCNSQHVGKNGTFSKFRRLPRKPCDNFFHRLLL